MKNKYSHLLVSEYNNITSVQSFFNKILRDKSLNLKQRLSLLRECQTYINSAIEAVEYEYETKEEELAKLAFLE